MILKTSLWWLLVWLPLLLMVAACPKLGEWRDRQIATSSNLAQGQQIKKPQQAVSMPPETTEDLPINPSFTVLEYTEHGSHVHVSVLSAWDAQQTTIWLVGEMARRGYESGDNASRILEGATYYHDKARFESIWLKVNLNTASQCSIEMIASEAKKRR